MSIQLHHVIHVIQQGDLVVRKSILLVVIFFHINLFGQTGVKKEKIGQVTFLTSQNIYVRFENTQGISVNDTLYVRSGNKLVPAVMVKYVSSSSCSGSVLGFEGLKVNDVIVALVFEEAEMKIEPVKEGTEIAKKNLAQETSLPSPAQLKALVINAFAKRVNGRFSISSYSSLSNTGGLADIQSWRYSLALDADSLLNSPVSFSSYTNFVYRADQWNSITSHLGDAIRIYDFAFKYVFSKKTKLVLGRKINPKTSSLGAIDGIQFETSVNRFTLGTIIGSRPDFSNYGLNAKLFEYGGYVSRDDSISKVSLQNTIGVFQQTNDFKTDRRFLYFQHTSNFSQNFGLFFSSEFELYKRKKGVDQNVFDMSSIYLMASFTPSSWFSLSATYDARKNVVYYETFKNIADSILESATRQGLGVRLNLRPFNNLWLSTNFNYRFSAADPQPSRNYGCSLSYIQLPLIYSSLYASYNRIETGYVKGNYYSASINKDLFSGYFNLGLGYRRVEYNFDQSAYNMKQNIASVDLSWRILASTFFTLSYEGTFQDKQNYSHVYIGLNTRF